MIDFESTNSTCSKSDTEPSDTVRTCLTNAQAKTSATPSVTGSWPSGLTLNAEGAIVYEYYKAASTAAGVSTSYYGFGAQGLALPALASIAAVGTDAPFSELLSFPQFKIVDYQQVY